MKLYKYKIFDNLHMQYASVCGCDTWFTLPDTAQAFTQLLTSSNNRRYEVHEIYLTTMCRLEE